MAYKPILAPEEFHAWLKDRAERLNTSMADCLRGLPTIVDTADAPSASASDLARLSAGESAGAGVCASERCAGGSKCAELHTA